MLYAPESGSIVVVRVMKKPPKVKKTVDGKVFPRRHVSAKE